MTATNAIDNASKQAVAGEPQKNRIYINDQRQAEVAVQKMLRALDSGKFRTDVGLDYETSPIPGFEKYEGAPNSGYPGTQVGVRADKAQYLKFSQWAWAGSFNPTKLHALGLYVPQKITSGVEGNVSAGEAWLAFLRRVNELE